MTDLSLSDIETVVADLEQTSRSYSDLQTAIDSSRVIKMAAEDDPYSVNHLINSLYDLYHYANRNKYVAAKAVLNYRTYDEKIRENVVSTLVTLASESGIKLTPPVIDVVVDAVNDRRQDIRNSSLRLVAEILRTQPKLLETDSQASPPLLFDRALEVYLATDEWTEGEIAQFEFYENHSIRRAATRVLLWVCRTSSTDFFSKILFNELQLRKHADPDPVVDTLLRLAISTQMESLQATFTEQISRYDELLHNDDATFRRRHAVGESLGIIAVEHPNKRVATDVWSILSSYITEDLQSPNDRIGIVTGVTEVVELNARTSVSIRDSDIERIICSLHDDTDALVKKKLVGLLARIGAYAPKESHRQQVLDELDHILFDIYPEASNSLVSLSDFNDWDTIYVRPQDWDFILDNIVDELQYIINSSPHANASKHAWQTLQSILVGNESLVQFRQEANEAFHKFVQKETEIEHNKKVLSSPSYRGDSLLEYLAALYDLDRYIDDQGATEIGTIVSELVDNLWDRHPDVIYHELYNEAGSAIFGQKETGGSSRIDPDKLNGRFDFNEFLGLWGEDDTLKRWKNKYADTENDKNKVDFQIVATGGKGRERRLKWVFDNLDAVQSVLEDKDESKPVTGYESTVFLEGPILAYEITAKQLETVVRSSDLINLNPNDVNKLFAMIIRSVRSSTVRHNIVHTLRLLLRASHNDIKFTKLQIRTLVHIASDSSEAKAVRYSVVELLWVIFKYNSEPELEAWTLKKILTADWTQRELFYPYQTARYIGKNSRSPIAQSLGLIHLTKAIDNISIEQHITIAVLGIADLLNDFGTTHQRTKYLREIVDQCANDSLSHNHRRFFAKNIPSFVERTSDIPFTDEDYNILIDIIVGKKEIEPFDAPGSTTRNLREVGAEGLRNAVISTDNSALIKQHIEKLIQVVGEGCDSEGHIIYILREIVENDPEILLPYRDKLVTILSRCDQRIATRLTLVDLLSRMPVDFQ